MIIAMTLSMSGGRDDGRPWFGIGIPFEVSDEEGGGLVFWHHAVDLTGQVTREQLSPDKRLPGTGLPPASAPVSLPAGTAAGPLDNPPPVVQEAPPVAKDEPEPARVPGAEPVSPDPDPDPDPEPDLVLDEPAEPPKPADPKQAWFDYAVGQGLTGKKIDEVTKADLMSQYGGRL